LHARGINPGGIKAALLRINQTRCVPPLSEEEVSSIVQSVQRYSAGTTFSQLPNSGALPYTDLGNAERLIAAHGSDLLYNYTDGYWYIWRGSRWIQDTTEQVKRWAHEVPRQMMTDAESIADEQMRKAMLKHARLSESERGTRAMLSQAQPYLGVTTEVFDNDRWLLNCSNGTIELRTGELRPHRQDDYITKMIQVPYDSHASCEHWWKFLIKIFDNNTDLIAFAQRAIGYTLTGDVSEQCLFFLYGSGRNGKSTFTETIMRVLGEFQIKASTDMLVAKPYGSGIPNDIARLAGIRMVVAAEIEAGRRLAESRVKDLTGGDTLTARFLHKEFFDFPPSHKLWIYGNHKPTVRGTDEGIWRRIILIPFLIEIPLEDCDPHFREKYLDTELPGILAWMVQGCQRWLQHGLKPPPDVLQATRAYRDEMDVLSSFIEECCDVAESSEVQCSVLYARYKVWCDQIGEHPMGHRTFGEELERRGFQRYHRRTGEYRRGLRIRETDTSLPLDPDEM